MEERVEEEILHPRQREYAWVRAPVRASAATAEEQGGGRGEEA